MAPLWELQGPFLPAELLMKPRARSDPPHGLCRSSRVCRSDGIAGRPWNRREGRPACGKDRMRSLEDLTLDQVVDTARYPLSDVASPRGQAVVSRARHDLSTLGCTVLPDFVRPSLRDVLRQECSDMAPRAHHDVETVNVYNIAVDSALPEDHPGRKTFERGNAFVARDRVPADSLIARLYSDVVFRQFIAHCFELPELHELADPLSGLVLNVIAPGLEHPWHFDTNEFTVSMLTQQAQDGGVFEYCPNIRTPQNENFDDVRDVVDG